MVKVFLKEKGQSTVEYLLLLSVIMSLFLAVMKSDYFKTLFGSESEIFAYLRNTIEYTYRHGRFGQGGSANYNGSHDTYFSNGSSRFFSPTDPYPSEDN